MSFKRKSYHRLRRTIQTVSIFALNPFLFQYQQVCVPVLNCWGCPAAAFACPVGAIGLFLARGMIPFIVIGLILLIGALIGRMLCGWICPFGFLQELLHKIPSPKKALPDWAKHVKYGVLIIMVLMIPIFFGTDKGTSLAAPSNYFFCTLCPAGSLEVVLPRTLGLWKSQCESGSGAAFAGVASCNPTAFTWAFFDGVRLILLGGFLLSFIAYNRPFCRMICPIGAMFAVFNRFSLYQMKVQAEKCKSCYICKDKCPVDHEIFLDQSGPECVRCLDCTDCAFDAINSKEKPAVETQPVPESEPQPAKPTTKTS